VVLSTTELEPKTNIIGLQSRRVDHEHFPKEANPSEYSTELFSEVPMVVDPKHASQLLFAVPSSQPRHGRSTFRPQPYMQVFDVATQHTVTRQALTRNNATDPNVTPDGGKIEEPNVRSVQISHDGKWLATVDEWVPPPTDTGYLDEGIPEFNEEERNFRRETYLKFWSWDEKNGQWILESRIDAPHLLASVGASARVMDLVVDPAAAGFATIGEDRSVRIWRPKTRTRDGVTVRGDTGEGLVSWSLSRSVELNCNLDVLGHDQGDLVSQVPKYARVAFSQDGSMLAAGISDAESGVIHIIDAAAGTIRRSITELDVSVLSAVGILGRHLVVVSRSIAVWDLVADELVYCIPDAANNDVFDSVPQARLAINAESGTFAVALPTFEVNSSKQFMKGHTTVAVFDPYHSQAIWQNTTQNYILSLVPEKDGKGYISLDTDSCIKSLTPDRKPMQLPSPPPESAPLPLDNKVEDEEDDESSTMDITADDEFIDQENDKPVVRSEDLMGVFDVGAHALPPVKDLFNAVVGLYARKPRALGAA
jgi:NET1-associated nuclear protein 1 (U3 small nucleolar RNA-associated protein 17)